MIISVVSQKGGAGKTTTAVNVAAELQRRGANVLLVDGDPQGTARDWTQNALEADDERPAPPTTVAMGSDMHKRSQLPKIAASYDHVVIDTPPRHGTVMKSSLVVADLAVVVCRPTPADLAAIGDTLDLLDEVRDVLRDDLLVALLLTQRPPGRSLVAEASIRAIEAEENLRVLNTQLYGRTAYQQAIGLGVGVTHLEPHGKAAEEVRALVDEILALKEEP